MGRVVTKSLVFLASLVAVLMLSQSAPAIAADHDLDCEGGRKTVGDLGIAGMSFKGSMSYNTETGESKWFFQAEPKIRKVDPRGPAAGQLEPGDVIVAIDGIPITTHKAGQRFGNILPGESVSLSVRREGRVIDTVITPRAVCPEDSPMHIESFGLTGTELQIDKLSEALESLSRISELDIDIPELPESIEIPELPKIPRFDFRLRAWFGMKLACDGCTITRSKEDGIMKWSFDKPPKVSAVEPGSPAEKAGIEPDDKLTHVDGIRLDSEKGGKRFSSVEPGDTVTWTIRREGKQRTVRMVAVDRPEEGVEIREDKDLGKSLEHGGAPLRFSGTIAGADVEVRGDRSVRVIEDEGTGEVLILTCGAQIRVRAPAEAPAKKAPAKAPAKKE